MRISIGLTSDRRRALPAHHLPQATALFRVQRLQPDNPEHLEERLAHIVQFAEAAGGGAQQDDLRFRLKDFAELPAEIVVDVTEE